MCIYSNDNIEWLLYVFQTIISPLKPLNCDTLAMISWINPPKLDGWDSILYLQVTFVDVIFDPKTLIVLEQYVL